MNSRCLKNLLLPTVLLAASFSNAALNAYFTLKGQKSGVITGGVTQKGREGSLTVLDYDHTIISPRDPQSGLPTGKRMHKPFRILVELDRSGPLLYQMLCTNENISAADLKFWTPQLRAAVGQGTEVQSFTIHFTNANLASMRLLDSETLTNMPSIAHKGMVVELTFTYQKITWTWNDGGITAGDDWEARV